MERSDIVMSLRGRDAGTALFIVGVETPYVLLSDGRRRRAEKPKRKKSMHVRFLGHGEGPAAEKLRAGGQVTNNEVRRALREYARNVHPGVPLG